MGRRVFHHVLVTPGPLVGKENDLSWPRCRYRLDVNLVYHFLLHVDIVLFCYMFCLAVRDLTSPHLTTPPDIRFLPLQLQAKPTPFTSPVHHDLDADLGWIRIVDYTNTQCITLRTGRRLLQHTLLSIAPCPSFSTQVKTDRNS